jgi:hypothetical protein
MEQWKNVKHGMFISDLGRVKIISDSCEKITYGNKSSEDYRRVGRFYVHRLVAEAFCEKREGCNIVNHLNGIKSDNRAINLEWTTYDGNNKHAFESGIRQTYSENHWSSISKELVYQIYELKKSGKKLFEVARVIDLNYGTLKSIYHGRNWRYEYEKVFGAKFQKSGLGGAVCWNAMPKETVLKIYELKKQGMTATKIADELKLNRRTVSSVYVGKNWKHLYKEHF